MTADNFLKEKGWYAGSLMLSKTKGQGLVSITEAMEEYHQAKLKLLGIANVEQSEQLVCPNCKSKNTETDNSDIPNWCKDCGCEWANKF